MKKSYILGKVIFLLFTSYSLLPAATAQPPEKMSYQAVIRDAGNHLVTTQIGMRISILQGSSGGTAVYVETQTPTPNANGLVSVEIGGGSVVSGTFAGIDWSDGPYFIMTETDIDPAGGLTGYSITGTSQLLSVPFALYTKTVESYPETDPVFGTWDKSSGISIPASQVIDFQTSVTNNTEVLSNTAKVTNATHTGDATGSVALTLATVNSNVGTFNNITINAKGLATAGSNVSYLTSETDPTVKAINGIVKSNGTVISAATAGTDYLTPIGSAASLTGFPTLNQNTTGSAASFTGNLVGEVTGTQGSTVVGNSAVIGKVLTGYVSGAGTVATTDNILQAIQKLNGNTTHYIGESCGGGKVFYVYDNGQHGLIATNSDMGQSEWRALYSTGADISNGIGAGSMNTILIVTLERINGGGIQSAAGRCFDYSNIVGGVTYGDWYLPSLYELNLLYLQKTIIGNFTTGKYWSSNEYDSTNANYCQFSDGTTGFAIKSTSYYVRPIRAF
jgi:hypothetical protein